MNEHEKEELRMKLWDATYPNWRSRMIKIFGKAVPSPKEVSKWKDERDETEWFTLAFDCEVHLNARQMFAENCKSLGIHPYFTCMSARGTMRVNKTGPTDDASFRLVDDIKLRFQFKQDCVMYKLKFF